jgi:predicted ArsR family transcriptional regulator
MTQDDSLTLLKNIKKWVCSKDVSNILDISIESARRNLTLLHKDGFILRRSILPARGRGKFVYKIRAGG